MLSPELYRPFLGRPAVVRRFWPGLTLPKYPPLSIRLNRPRRLLREECAAFEIDSESLTIAQLRIPFEAYAIDRNTSIFTDL